VICAEAGGVDAAHQKGMEAFQAAYQKKFGSDVKLYAPYVYDAVMTMVKAMQNAKSADPAKYLPELAKIQYQGVTGLIAFDAKGDIKNGALTIYTFKDGKREVLEVTK
jgi:branched-chain amino acid transport system substrate-binding protein